MGGSRFAPTALMSLASSKRSRVVTALIFTTFVLFFFSRLGEPGAYLVGAGGAKKQSLAEQQQHQAEYKGPRFELFGIPDFAAEVEVATLNIKVKEEAPGAGTPAEEKTGLTLLTWDEFSRNKDHSQAYSQSPSPSPARRDSWHESRDSHDSSISSLQYQLPISLPVPTKHDLSAPDFNISDLEAPRPGTPPASVSLSLPPLRPQPDASKLIFGVATMLERMPENLRNFQHWAAHTNARFVVVHEPQNTTLRPGEPSPDDVRRLYRDAGIPHLDLVERDLGWGRRFVSLLGELGRRVRSTTDWGVLIDDDTFFFDLEAVQGMLAKYDPSRPWYVGTLSDNKWNVNNGGLYAMGGAGVFVSRDLLKTMGPLADAGACFPAPPEPDPEHPDQLRDRDADAGGDVLVGRCVHRHTTTKLTLEHGLYQLDMHGDVTGFYEAVRPQPLSAHHWKSWHHHDLPGVGAVARACGRACVLQSFRFRDGWQMSNGFSLVRYGYGANELAAQHPLAMEHTWKRTVWDIEDSWDYSLAPLKERDEGKVQFLMEKSVVEDAGTVVLYYVRRENGVGKGLVRVTWRREALLPTSFGSKMGDDVDEED